VVAKAIDGDTIELADGKRIRYLLVDTPETFGTTECYGPEAKSFNTSLVEGQTVSLSYSEACTDKYDRLLAYVSLEGRDVNRLLLERGYACVLYIPPAGSERKDDYEAAQSLAKSEKRGHWGACSDNPCN
jgi:micrococcal nuclease